MNLFSIAASDMDVIIGVIAVVGWILSQILSKKKIDPSQQEGSTPEAGTSTDPREELRKFFEDLEKTNKSPAPQPPAVPPAPPPHHRTHKEKFARRIHEPRIETLSIQQSLAVSTTEASPAFQGMVTPKPLATPTHPMAMPELRNPTTLRKFMIANEILGKPVALRQGSGN